jgi:hypothetical protein
MTGDTRARSFEALTRGVARGDLSRRKALTLLGAVLVGGSLSSTAESAAAAKNWCSSNPCTDPGTTCCATAKGIACCGLFGLTTCCIRQGRPSCEPSAEQCRSLHGRVG